MNKSQRVNRGFNRLAIFLAAVPLLVGVLVSANSAWNDADNAYRHHQADVCLHNLYQKGDGTLYATLTGSEPVPSAIPGKHIIAIHPTPKWWQIPAEARVDPLSVHCSHYSYSVTFSEIVNPPNFRGRSATFASSFGPGFAITLVVVLAVYGLVDAIGWVVGGFAAS